MRRAQPGLRDFVRSIADFRRSDMAHRSLLRLFIAGVSLPLFAHFAGSSAADRAPPPVSPAQAQFGGQSAEGLAKGRHVMTDCSITWTDKDQKIYCFETEAAKAEFLKGPQEILERARSFVAADNVLSTEDAMKNFQGSDAEILVKGQIESTIAANGGSYPFVDELNDEHLKLAFDGIDFTRTIDGSGFWCPKNRRIANLSSADESRWQVAGGDAPANSLVVDSGIGASRPRRAK